MLKSTIFDAFLRLREQAAAQPKRFIETSRPVWIFGAGQFGRSLALALKSQGIAVAGFVETAPQASTVQGLPVLDWATLARTALKAQLVMGILNHRIAYKELVAIAMQAGFATPLMPWEIYDHYHNALGWRFWLGERRVLTAHLERLGQIAERMGDDESRETLLRLCAFRLGMDLEFSNFQSSAPQYFNKLTLPPLKGRAVTYIDCGAFDGDTFSELLQQPGITCQQALLLEPDPDNYAALVQRISGNYPQATCLPLAAADRYTMLRFTAGQGAGSAIGSEGDLHIAAAALDQIAPQTQVDLIKLDVEGAEALVLRGARQMIERCRPVLAISLYHNPTDLWELPELLFQLCKGYAFYIRQHCCNSFDSVLYAIPHQNFE